MEVYCKVLKISSNTHNKPYDPHLNSDDRRDEVTRARHLPGKFDKISFIPDESTVGLGISPA